MENIEFPKICIVLVCYNQRADVVRVLNALSKQTMPASAVFLVDNSPEDGTGELVKKDYPWVDLLEPCENVGYAAGNNIGIREALRRDAEWILLLNTDTEPDPDFLERFWAAVEKNPAYGAYMPLILYGDRETIWAAVGCIDPVDMIPSHDLQGFPASYAPDSVRPVGFVVGCAFMMPAEVAQRTGGFDETLFMYYEDSELSFRIKELGYDVVYVPGAPLVHHAPEEFGDKFGSPLLIYYLKRNRLKLVMKYSRKRWLGLFRAFLQDAVSQALLITRRQNVGGALGVVDAWVDFLTGKSGKK